MSMRTPLSSVRGLGAAKDGTRHFWHQRVTAVASLPLTIFLIALGVSLVGEPHAVVVARLASPLIAVPLIATIIAFAYHMQLGIQVIIEDYVHDEMIRLLSLMGNNFFCIAVTLFGVLATIKISVGG